MAIPLPNNGLSYHGPLNAVITAPYASTTNGGAVPATLPAPVLMQSNVVAAPTTVAVMFGNPPPGAILMPMSPEDFAVVQEHMATAPRGACFVYKGHAFLKPLCPGLSRVNFELSAQAPPPVPESGVISMIFDPEMNPETVVSTT
jgi:hypothetical protein